MHLELEALTAFIVAAKRDTSVGGAECAVPSRVGAHDLIPTVLDDVRRSGQAVA
jgi:hypothetical protein